MAFFFIGILIILSGGFVSLLVKEKWKSYSFFLFLLIGLSFIFIDALAVLVKGKDLTFILNLSYPIGDVRFTINKLSAFFIIVFSFTSLMSSLFAIDYIRPYLNSEYLTGLHFFSFAFLIISMLLIPVINNALFFLFVWELMSLSSFILVIFDSRNKDVFKAGINYLIAMHICLLFLIVPLSYLSMKTGSYDFDSFRIFLSDKPALSIVIFLFLFAGFGTKAGFVPFHTWLPLAHPAAPAHVSGIMSGIMIKTGIYGIFLSLNITNLNNIVVALSLLTLSLFTAFFGIIYSLKEKDMKKSLAYSSIENIGIIGVAISIGLIGKYFNNPMILFLGFTGALLHILNHSLFKSLLFFSSGVVYQTIHNRNIEKMGGLVKFIPFTAFAFMIGALSVSALPPLNGFISEFFIYLGFLEILKTKIPLYYFVSIIGLSFMAFIGAICLYSFTRLFSISFLGNYRGESKIHKDNSFKVSRIPMSMIIAVIFILGLCPGLYLDFIAEIFSSMASIDISSVRLDYIFNITSNLSLIGIVVIILTTLFYIIIKLNLRKKTNSSFKTWDCGYQNGSARIQYTASSYSESFVELTKPILMVSEKRESDEEIFPKKASLETSADDYFELAIKKPIEALFKFFEIFSKIQSRNTRQYIIYAIVFIIITIIWITLG